jgi:23S rRNA (adenine1618-N6)-methyltransferase
MHPRNRHQDRYDLNELSRILPELTPFIKINEYKDQTIDFSDSKAVKALNKAILKSFYNIGIWDIPESYLCPPIPGRADYIHTVSDLFTKNRDLRVLDIGTGANAIYPLLGCREYNWSFIGSDVDSKAIANAESIVKANSLHEKISFRQQKNSQHIFQSIILDGEFFDLTICNPPFHESLEEASRGTSRKWKNLGKKPKEKTLNFGGQGSELWCPGGEKAFILKMIEESSLFQSQVGHFSTLVSKEANLPVLIKTLNKTGAQVRILEMAQGQKKSRVLSWTFKN